MLVLWPKDLTGLKPSSALAISVTLLFDMCTSEDFVQAPLKFFLEQTKLISLLFYCLRKLEGQNQRIANL